MTTWTLDATLPTLDTGTPQATLDGSTLIGGVTAAQFSWSPSYAVPRKITFKLRKAAFGDGYTQRSGVGINNIVRRWDLRFNAKTESVAQAINDFLEAREDGKAFHWVPPFLNPGSETILVTCEEFTITPVTYNSFDITATFEQVYGE